MEMPSDINRIQWIDSLKGFLIILVIIGHMTLPYDSLFSITAFIYTFHVPLFFMVSGLLSSNISKTTTTIFLKKRFVSLIIPYLSFSLIGSFVRGGGISDYFLSSIKGGLWFLPALFAYSILLLISSKIVVKINNLLKTREFEIEIVFLVVVVIFLALLHLFLPTNLQDPLMTKTLLLYWPYYALGYAVSRYNLRIPDGMSAVSGILFFIIWFLNVNEMYNEPIVLQFSRLCAVVFFYSSFSCGGGCKLFTIIGKETMSIYILHYYFIANVSEIILKYVGEVMFLEISAFFCFAFMISGMCIMIKKILGSNKYLGLFLFGKSENG